MKLAAFFLAMLAQGYRIACPRTRSIYFLLPDRFENGDPPMIAAG
jgi:hypothetical protein